MLKLSHLFPSFLQGGGRGGSTLNSQLSKMYINFHTHIDSEFDDTLSIVNVDINLSDNIDYKFCSVGFHPWNITENWELLKPTFESIVTKSNVLMIGEAGLDKKCNTDFQLQTEVFLYQISLSEKYKKPLIIHCVGAFNEIIALKRKLKPTQNWVIHGFNNRYSIAKSLFENGFWLSLGSIFENKTIDYKLILELFKDRYFLETDDSTKSIKDLYKHLNTKNMSEFEHNFKLIFPTFNL